MGMESLDLEIDGDLSPLATTKGESLAKLASQLPIGSRLRARWCGAIPARPTGASSRRASAQSRVPGSPPFEGLVGASAQPIVRAVREPGLHSRLGKASATLSEARLWVDDTANLSTGQLQDKARLFAECCGIQR